MTNKVLVVGSYNVDMTITTEKLPQVGETVLGKSLQYGHGGKGANQAVAAARAGAEVNFLAKVGADQYGEQAISSLALENIHTDLILQDLNLPTGMAMITVDQTGDNSIVVISGANWSLSDADIKAQSRFIGTADILLVQLETPMPSVAAAIEIASSQGVKVILNPAPAKFIDAQLLKHVTIITPNRVEAQMLTGVDLSNNHALPTAADILHEMGVETVLITLGSEGVYVSAPRIRKLVPSIKVRAIDTVGAGDVFSGVLAAHYKDPSTLEESVTLALTAAGMSVTKLGAQAAIPHLDEVRSFLKETALVTSL